MVRRTFPGPRPISNGMIYTIRGKIISLRDSFVVVECGGVGFKIFTSKTTLHDLTGKPGRTPQTEPEQTLFYCFLYVRESELELYGFADERSLKLFEMLNSVSGVGPKTALAVLDLDSATNIMAAIIEKKPDFLTRTSGIGRKTAERIILDLGGKLKLPEAKMLTEKMRVDVEVEEALVSLGYERREVKRTLQSLDDGTITIEDRLKSALKNLGKRAS